MPIHWALHIDDDLHNFEYLCNFVALATEEKSQEMIFGDEIIWEAAK